jgi:hypothetical protein
MEIKTRRSRLRETLQWFEALSAGAEDPFSCVIAFAFCGCLVTSSFMADLASARSCIVCGSSESIGWASPKLSIGFRSEPEVPTKNRPGKVISIAAIAEQKARTMIARQYTEASKASNGVK